MYMLWCLNIIFIKRNQSFLEKQFVLGLGQEVYKKNIEQFVMLEIKEVIKD